MTYDDWCEHHMTVFGLHTEQDGRMILEWAKLFQAEGYTPEELFEATKFMALNNPPQFRTEHLRQLRERMSSQRARTKPVYDHPLGQCGVCGSTGFIGVPAAGSLTKAGNIVDDDSVKTVSVRCACAMGRAFQGIQGVLSIEEYERSHPNWREHLCRIKEIVKRRLSVSDRAGFLDQALGQILAKARRKE